MFPRRASAAMLAACLLAMLCVPVAAGEPTSGIVVKAYDGDTITVESGGVRYKCRLLGIDAPEISYGRLRSEMEKVVKYAAAEARQEIEAARRTFEKWAAVMEARAREARDALAATVDDAALARAVYEEERERMKREYGIAGLSKEKGETTKPHGRPVLTRLVTRVKAVMPTRRLHGPTLGNLTPMLP